MKDWSGKLRRQEDVSVEGGSSIKRISISEPRAPVWVTHAPTPDDVTDGNDAHSMASTPPYAEKVINENEGGIKGRLKSLIPSSLGRMMASLKGERESIIDFQVGSGGSRIPILPNGTRVSPPLSPLLGNRHWDGSLDKFKPLLRGSPTDDLLYHSPQEESLLTSIHPAEYYAEKLEVYNQKYSYLKSWPGLLRLLAGLELLFGGMAIACVIAYIQKDNEWSSNYGLYNGIYNNGQGLSGYSYRGPMTPFILSVAGISWIITLILLVMGMTMYYRTILLDAPWWPLTEAFINVALFLLYMAAGIVYLNDLNRGGLCYMTIGVSPILANLCRVDGGQMAGTAFIFINMAMYLGSFLVCLKMWRHEATRREREYLENNVPPEENHGSIPLTPQKPKHISFKDERDSSGERRGNNKGELISENPRRPVGRREEGAAPACVPKVHIISDFVMKYPEISCVEEREKYKAVFNDQYQEYKDLHKDISATFKKFSQLDGLMAQLLRDGRTQEDQHRIQGLMIKYQEKKSDPSFLEKKERCEYLKAKLSHIKSRIRTFDQETFTQNK